MRISTIVRQRNITGTEAAGLFGLPEAGLSRLDRGECCEYSLEFLFRPLTVLSLEIEIIIRR